MPSWRRRKNSCRSLAVGFRPLKAIFVLDDGEKDGLMANTKNLSREERKKSKRAKRKEREQKNPKKKRDYARGSKKRKMKKMARGQAKR